MDETKKEMSPWWAGFWTALQEFGIWKNGEQVTECMQTPIKDAMNRSVKTDRLIQQERFDMSGWEKRNA